MPILNERWRMRPRHNWYSRMIRKYYNLRVNLTKPRNPISDSEILKKVEREKKLVIQIPFGGLGDHLAYSSLPELLWEQKGIKTFISDRSIFRSEAIRHFVWDLNPYVEFSSQTGWFSYKTPEHGLSSIDAYFQNLFGLKGKGTPRAYYTPNLIHQLKGATIIDPSCGAAGKANGYFFPEFHRSFVRYIKDNIGEFVLITHAHGIGRDLEHKIRKALKPPCYEVSTIQELADVLFSASSRYVLHSGGASLAAALNLETRVVNYLRPSTYDSFKYPLNRHIHLI